MIAHVTNASSCLTIQGSLSVGEERFLWIQIRDGHHDSQSRSQLLIVLVSLLQSWTAVRVLHVLYC